VRFILQHLAPQKLFQTIGGPNSSDPGASAPFKGIMVALRTQTHVQFQYLRILWIAFFTLLSADTGDQLHRKGCDLVEPRGTEIAFTSQ
jgi:hypothetical protein